MATITVYKTQDVFGISRNVPENYVAREGIDDKFKELKRDKHIVIFGSSKQGKTSLRKKNLKQEDYITIHCSNQWDIGDINANILKRAGFEIKQSVVKTERGKNKIVASLTAKVLGIGSSLQGEKQQEKETAITSVQLELDIDDVNDIINALAQMKFSKLIILEDFHYLKPETQKDFAVELKAFHENSNLCFVIVGVWLEENRLIVYNGDLTGRVMAINADKWTKPQLLEVIKNGEQLLYITFTDDFKNNLINNCQESVYIVQEACYKACELKGIEETQEENIVVNVDKSVQDIIKEIVNQQSGRYNSFIIQFADGFQDTTLQMYKWLLYPILTATTEELEKGLRYSEIRKKLEQKHPRGEELNSGNITQALKFTASLQINKGVKPTILDYDESNLRLHVVDRGFILWLQYQKKEDLLDAVGLPLG
ncbi:hypothetical protein [Desulfotruncus arcticus]|nr:hypothetical protein [Desulfotruncus arcticus]